MADHSVLPAFTSHLSEQEKEIIYKVNREYFFTRCLPLSIGAMFGVRTCMKMGYFTTRYSLIKHTVAGTFGYLVGKVQAGAEGRRRILRDVPDGFYAKMTREWSTLTEEQKRIVGAKWQSGHFDLPSVVLNIKLDTEDHASPVARTSSVTQATGGVSYPQDTRISSYQSDNYSRSMSTDTMETPPPDSTTNQEGPFSYSSQRDKWMSGEGSSSSTRQDDTSAAPAPMSYQKERDRWLSEDTKSPTQPWKQIKTNRYGDEME